VAGILPNLFHHSLGPSSCFGISQRELKANVPSHVKFFRFVNVAILLVPLTSMLFPSVLLLLLCFFIHYFLTSALLPHYRKSCKQRVPHYCLSKQASKLRCSVAGCVVPTVLRRKLFLSTSPIAKLCSILYCKSWYGSIVTGCLLCGLKLSRAARQRAIAETRLMARRRGYS
jgi:hypothetical protein